MIKFSATKDDKLLYGFGLSERNIEMLKSGMPISVELEQMGGTGSVMIFYGRTESEMYNTLKQAGVLSPDVQIHEQKQIHEG